MKVEINGEEKYFDGYLLNAFEQIKKLVARKWDGIFYVGGYEGDGKSEFAGQMAYFFDNTYCLERCVFTPEQFIEAVEKAEPGQAIVYDEAQDVMESTNRDRSAREIKSLMTRIRKKQLFIIIVAPDFWRINKYLFIHRARAFIRIYSNGLDRGFFEYYNRERKHRLKIEGQRNEQLCVKPNFRGRFAHWFPLDQEAYENKKDEATSQIGRKKDKFEQKYLAVREKILRVDYLKNKQCAELLDVSERQVTRLRGALSTKEDMDCSPNNNLTYSEVVR